MNWEEFQLSDDDFMIDGCSVWSAKTRFAFTVQSGNKQAEKIVEITNEFSTTQTTTPNKPKSTGDLWAAPLPNSAEEKLVQSIVARINKRWPTFKRTFMEKLLKMKEKVTPKDEAIYYRLAYLLVHSDATSGK